MSQAEALRWRKDRPKAIVVACSDGRLQAATDAVMRSLGHEGYDRLYLPGGPGALVGTEEPSRAFTAKCDLANLVNLHGLSTVVLLFHAPTAKGPEEAICGDYRRRLSYATLAEVRKRQEEDAMTVAATLGVPKNVEIVAVRLEVDAEQGVSAVRLNTVKQ